eukprot:115868_1
MEEQKTDSISLQRLNDRASHRDVTAVDSIQDEETDANDEEIEKGKKFINMFGRMLPYLYGMFAIGILGVYVTGFVMSDLADIMIIAMLGAILILAFLGVWAVYKYGVIQDQIERLKDANDVYEYEIDGLKSTRTRLGTQRTELQTAVTHLTHDATELEKETKEFEGLVEELRHIESDNQDIMDKLDNAYKICTDMRKVASDHEKAHLLSTFYSYAFRDDDKRMNEKEYTQFLRMISRRHKKKFEELGTFRELAGKDGQIDLQEFHTLMDKLTEVDEI